MQSSMKWTAGVLSLMVPALAWADGAVPHRQDWFGTPILPDVFRSDGDAPPYEDLRPRQDGPSPGPVTEPVPPESTWGKGLSALDLEAWQREDDLRVIREWAGDALLGLPLLLPQLVLEGVLPRGVQVGPTTFLYRTSPASSSLVIVVLDQMLFHEAEFLSRVREIANDDRDPEDLTRGQRGLLRRSLMTGLRATYSVPGLTLAMVLQTASEQGPAGVLLIPPLGAAVLYFKGIDHKVRIEEHLQIRFKLGAGREWHHGVTSADGISVLSIDVRLFDLPVGILGSFDLFRRGMEPAFIGLGTSLDAVEELLSAERTRDDPVD